MLEAAEAPPRRGRTGRRDSQLCRERGRTGVCCNIYPLFFSAALKMLQERPELRIAFGVSPFTPLEQVRVAIERGGDPRVFAQRGRVVHSGERWYLESLDGRHRIPVVFQALPAARRARLALTIPGTKTIELAALGKPAVAITPYNAPELVAVNGPLTYLDRVPLVGVPLKRSVAMAVAKRFDVPPRNPTWTPRNGAVRTATARSRLAAIARVYFTERYDDAPWIAATGTRLERLYLDHAGAADRMAASLLALAG